MQRRLRLAGMRPINNIVDATNYVMLEIGQPLHAFDYDVLAARAGGKPVHIITRRARDGETLTTLDGVERKLDDSPFWCATQQGPLSMGGVMGGAECEVSDTTRTSCWKARPGSSSTSAARGQHSLPSEAAFRFSRGVHPALTERGVRRGHQDMRLGRRCGRPGPGGRIPAKPVQPVITVTPADVKRLLGIDLTTQEIVDLLERLEFKCSIHDLQISVTAPANRLDIGEGIVGLADVLEEVARSYGYDRIPSTNMADALPPQVGNEAHEWEEGLRDLLATLGLDEVVSYRLTSPEDEARASCRRNRKAATFRSPIPLRRRSVSCAAVCSPPCWMTWSATPGSARAWPSSRSARCSSQCRATSRKSASALPSR